MSQLERVAFVGNSLPRRCGIATFTTDLQQAVAASGANVETAIVAMTDANHDYDYGDAVVRQIHDSQLEEYARAADFLNDGNYDVVSLQHEFGIFGGEAGGHITTLLSRLTMPVVTTLHTVLAAPTPAQRDVMNRVLKASSRVVVMADKGRELLRTVYRLPAEKIDVIPHGIPDCAFVDPHDEKARLGFSGRTVILTFGLLSPSKGIEVMIDAMPTVLKSRADAVYVVLGATHPNLVRDQGEAYRANLIARAKELGIEKHVVFVDQFVDIEKLLAFISMCDVYVTPYLNEAQMTSGTLAYSFGLGKPVVSTPYWHARELLADGRGILVPFGDVAATGREIAGLLSDAPRRQAMRRRAYASSRSMTWDRTADRYVASFDSAWESCKLKVIARRDNSVPRHAGRSAPEIQTDHLLSMCDDTGLLQHAIYAIPDRRHGYCIDDNARALLLASALDRGLGPCLPNSLVTRLAAFVQHSWNPGTKRFRNFMSFERRWMEECGSEDSHGRTLWALGECARGDAQPSRKRWATVLFAEALQVVESFRSPRAWAFALLGLDGYCAAVPEDAGAQRLRHLLADRLVAQLSAAATKQWVWFEDGLSYDNARLSQALIVTGDSTGTDAYVEAGLKSLRWLTTLQKSPAGCFRPVGTDGFGGQRTAPRPFDQQPVEAAATISACLAAGRVEDDAQWTVEADRAFAWFLGDNDLSIPLVDLQTGSCSDGLHHDRANENRGAESTLSYLLALAEMSQIARSGADGIRPYIRIA